VGIGQALEWCCTGRVFDAAEALAGRLVSKVLSEYELLSAVYSEGIAAFLEKRPPGFLDKVSLDVPDFHNWWDEPNYS